MSNNEFQQDDRVTGTPVTSRAPPGPSGLGAQRLVRECAVTAGIKLPPIIPEESELWFMQVEAKFRLHGVRSDQTKFDMVVASLDRATLIETADLVKSPPSSLMYETIKKRVISCNTDGPQARVNTLLQGIREPNQKPSKLLTLMRHKVPNMPDDILEALWVKQMPQNLHETLLFSNLSLDEKARQADIAVQKWELSATETTSCEDDDEPAQQVSTVEQKVDDLARLVEMCCDKVDRQVNYTPNRGNYGSNRGNYGSNRSNYGSNRGNYGPNRGNYGSGRGGYERNRQSNSQREQRRFSSPARGLSDNGVCWYHEEFGRRSDRCLPGCSMAPKN